MTTEEKLKEFEKAKAEINDMWSALWEQKEIATQAFKDAQQCLVVMSEANAAMAVYYVDIASRVKDVVKILTDENNNNTK